MVAVCTDRSVLNNLLNLNIKVQDTVGSKLDQKSSCRNVNSLPNAQMVVMCTDRSVLNNLPKFNKSKTQWLQILNRVQILILDLQRSRSTYINSKLQISREVSCRNRKSPTNGRRWIYFSIGDALIRQRSRDKRSEMKNGHKNCLC